jgi:hypothetical protein
LNTFNLTSSLSKERFVVLNLESGINNQLQFSVVGGEIPYFSYAIICRSDGAVAAIPHDILGNLYFNTFRNKVAPVFTKAIKNLLNIRNHLLLQLDLECGNISEDNFDKEESKYLSEVNKIPPEKLKEEINLLFNFTNLPFDSVDISEILNCSVDDVESAIKKLS